MTKLKQNNLLSLPNNVLLDILNYFGQEPLGNQHGKTSEAMRSQLAVYSANKALHQLSHSIYGVRSRQYSLSKNNLMLFKSFHDDIDQEELKSQQRKIIFDNKLSKHSAALNSLYTKLACSNVIALAAFFGAAQYDRELAWLILTLCLLVSVLSCITICLAPPSLKIAKKTFHFLEDRELCARKEREFNLRHEVFRKEEELETQCQHLIHN
ncbi:hypothetical protein J2N86_04950 [Legionella lytica]|jgi:hypothetical protein|uniref:F-box domain-containing protein n=1 Tax=Legionella lytica TaxID=96232 RepID=A0ABY4YAJ1_9GAMM|nr:hypothetical protein [Legionella lytica]USQ14655.1 hypothetical protein J2N86_04950 [Legionella lytica]